MNAPCFYSFQKPVLTFENSVDQDQLTSNSEESSVSVVEC